MNGDFLVSIENATFGYGASQMSVVANVSFVVRGGEFILFRGANGCGKSTIIKGMLGLAVVMKGAIRWYIDRTAVGYVPQENAIPIDIPYTALDIVTCAVKSSWKNSIEQARSALDFLEMGDKANVRFGALSGGQKRRVLFARALAKLPQLLILDEPTANVDMQTETIIEQKIADLISSGKTTVIAVAHSVAFGKNARVVQVKDGRIHE